MNLLLQTQCVLAARRFIQNEPNDDDSDDSECGHYTLGLDVGTASTAAPTPVELSFCAFGAKIPRVARRTLELLATFAPARLARIEVGCIRIASVINSQHSRARCGISNILVLVPTSHRSGPVVLQRSRKSSLTRAVRAQRARLACFTEALVRPPRPYVQKQPEL